jgi:hypothetical protein
LLTYEMLIDELGGSERLTVERIAARYQEDICAVREALAHLSRHGLCGCEPARLPCKDKWTLLRADSDEAVDAAIRMGIELDRLIGQELEEPFAALPPVRLPPLPAELFAVGRLVCRGAARLCTLDQRACGGLDFRRR